MLFVGVTGRQHSFLWILKTNIFLYKINKCSKKPYLYRFIGLKMSYNAKIMLGGAMLFNFDFRGADIVAVVLSFMVLYFAVVASLTDK